MFSFSSIFPVGTVVEHRWRSLGGIGFGFLGLRRRSKSAPCSTSVRRSFRHHDGPGHLFDLCVASPFLIKGIGTIAQGLRMGIRLSQEEHQQIQEAVRRLEYKGPSALVRRAIHNELVSVAKLPSGGEPTPPQEAEN